MCASQTKDLQPLCVVVSRSTVSKYNVRLMEAIVEKLGIPPFPLDDEQRLEELAQGFRDKSCGQLFDNFTPSIVKCVAMHNGV